MVVGCKIKGCMGKVAFQNPNLCRKHFTAYFEGKVFSTVKNYALCKKGDAVVVGVSGGKDSLVTAHLLSRICKVSLLAIDEGISGYREHTLKDLKKFNEKFGPFPLKIVSYETEFGNSLDGFLLQSRQGRVAAGGKGVHPCSICGTFRRHLLNKYSEGFPIIATGHNVDDEVQAILMNVIKGQPAMLQRIGPKTADKEGFTSKIKPLYFCTEKEVLAYSFLKGFEIGFFECPNAESSFRAHVRNSINDYERDFPGAKRKIVEMFMLLKRKSNFSQEKDSGREKSDRKQAVNCLTCGFPSVSGECRACQLKRSFGKVQQTS